MVITRPIVAFLTFGLFGLLPIAAVASPPPSSADAAKVIESYYDTCNQDNVLHQCVEFDADSHGFFEKAWLGAMTRVGWAAPQQVKAQQQTQLGQAPQNNSYTSYVVTRAGVGHVFSDSGGMREFKPLPAGTHLENAGVIAVNVPPMTVEITNVYPGTTTLNDLRTGKPDVTQNWYSVTFKVHPSLIPVFLRAAESIGNNDFRSLSIADGQTSTLALQYYDGSWHIGNDHALNNMAYGALGLTFFLTILFIVAAVVLSMWFLSRLRPSQRAGIFSGLLMGIGAMMMLGRKKD